MTPKTRFELISLLKEYKDVFCFLTKDMSGIPLELIRRELNAIPEVKLIKQKKRTFSVEKDKTIDADFFDEC